VYQECLTLEFSARGVAALPQPNLPISYKGQALSQTYIPDFLVEGKIIVELKSVRKLADEHRAQVMNYLKSGNFRLGLLVNFGHYPKAGIERIVL